MAVAIMGFVFPHTMQSMLEESFTDKIIHTYREDPDLQNFIDFAQQEASEFINKLFSISYGEISFFSSDAVDSVRKATWIGRKMSISTVLHPV